MFEYHDIFADSAQLEVWQGSFLPSSMPHVASALLADAQLKTLGPGEILEQENQLYVILEGSLRAYQRVNDGRELSFIYLFPGDTVGLALSIGSKSFRSIRIKVVATCHTVLLRMSASELMKMIEQDIHSLRLICDEIIRSLLSGQEMLAKNLSLPVKGRVALCLLELAERREHKLVVHATQQEIAKAAGTVRRVTVRVVRELKDQGVLTRNGSEWIITDEAKLYEISEHSKPAGAEVVGRN